MSIPNYCVAREGYAKPRPVTGSGHGMAKLKGSKCEPILKAAGGVFGDKGFIGTGCITMPIPEDHMPQAS
jgi:hypothetical protein